VALIRPIEEGDWPQVHDIVVEVATAGETYAMDVPSSVEETRAFWAGEHVVVAVDGDTVLSGDDLASVTVEGEVLNDLRGPKIVIQNYKNKTGYKRRMGFRADLTRVKITSITTK
jgi:ribosomal protein L21